MRPQLILARSIELLTAAGLTIAGCGTTIGTNTENTYTVTEPVTSLKINNLVGSIQVEGADVTTISVTEKLTYTGSAPKTNHSVSDRRLTLSYTCPSGINVSCSVSYLVKVPRRIAVQIDDNVGAVTLTGLAGQLTVTSGAGNIDATDLASDVVTARSNAGTITLAFATPPTTVSAQAQVGSVTVQLPVGTAYAVDAGSQVGAVDVTVQGDPGSAHRVTAHSQVGLVTVHNG